tara:strand:+ start:444 stop:641 length:198 start_codon:yes stop_codon:yes gene_type:complete
MNATLLKGVVGWNKAIASTFFLYFFSYHLTACMTVKADGVVIDDNPEGLLLTTLIFFFCYIVNFT